MHRTTTGPASVRALSKGCFMDWVDVFPWFALATFGAFGLSLKSFLEARSLRAEFSTLAATVRTLDARLQPPRTASPIDEPAAEAPPAAGLVPDSVPPFA